MGFSVPVVLLVFNRPVVTRLMFESVRQARPDMLLIVADGARPDHPNDGANCAAVRQIVTAVDWPCDVRVNFAETNMGLQKRVTSGLFWVFDQVEQAIVIEDDCVADPTFFQFCQEMLAHYADDKRIMSISGDNFLFGATPIPHSYYFSRQMHCWGWATWRRAWQLHDPGMPYWPELKHDGWLESFVTEVGERNHWHQAFDASRSGQLNSWATQWLYSIMRHNGLNIHPASNLVSNIGFSEDGVHCKQPHLFENIARVPMQFPLVHPPHVLRNFYADDHYARVSFRPRRQFNW